MPEMQPIPELPPLILPPSGEQSDNRDWWRALAFHYESRARRAEITQSFAVNIADAEREARESNAATAIGCTLVLRARDIPPAAQ